MTTPLSSIGKPRLNDTSRRDLTAAWRHVDVLLVLATLAIGVLGTLMVFSATRAKGGPDVVDTSFLRKELLFMSIGFVAMVAMTMFDYRRLLNWIWPIYGLVVASLLAVLVIGQRSNGAKSWFAFAGFQLQPAEIGKLGIIITMAAVISGYKGDIDLRRLGLILLIPGLPIALIMLQPDLGMVLVYLFVGMGMLLVGGVRTRYLVALLVAGVLVVFGVLNSNVLKQYQRDRLTAFVDPGRDLRGATYNIVQSTNAIGAGGVTGQGLFEGKQTQLGFVPEQQTDFIFTVVGEELGFVGAAALLGLYAIVIWRIWRAAALARDAFGTLICVGILSFIMFQVFENAGMTMQIMPVTGIPLPLVSYGGTSIVTTFMAVGLVLNIGMRRFR